MCYCAGTSSQVCPSSIRPAFFLLTPPHCLKKKATFRAWHWSRMSLTLSAWMGRDLGPDSPPAMTQSMCSRGRLGCGPRRGSSDRNRTEALLTFWISPIRPMTRESSTLDPIQPEDCFSLCSTYPKWLVLSANEAIRISPYTR